jgi:hypothetical protein
MVTIESNITQNEAEFFKARDPAFDLRAFTLFNAYFRLICCIPLKSIKENSRSAMKMFLKKGVALEQRFNQLTETHSLRPKLLAFINKLSNSQVIEYIKDVIERSDEAEFAIVYDFIRHPSSVSLRERLCRDDILITRSISPRQPSDAFPSLLRWNMVLKQVCRYCPYYVQDAAKFYSFFHVFCNYKDDQITLKNVVLADFKENDMKIMRHYVCANKKSMDFRNFYIQNFLSERCYNFADRITPFLDSLTEPTDFVNYFEVLKKMASEFYLQKPDAAAGDGDQVRFLINKVTVALIDRMPPELLGKLVEFLSFASRLIDKSTPAENQWCLLQLALVVLGRFQLNVADQKHKDFLTQFLKICWAQISNNNELNASLINHSKIIISIMNDKYDIFNVCNQDKCATQFYEYLLNQSFDDSQDDDVTSVWLESLRNMIPVCRRLDPKWADKFLSVFDPAKRPAYNQSSLLTVNRFWKALIICREFFRDQFVDIMAERFFKDQQVPSHNVFDLLLVLLVYVVQDRRVAEARAKVFSPEKCQLVLEKLIGILRNEQDSSKNFNDKFYGLILLYLKFFALHGLSFEVTKAMMDELLKNLKVDEAKQEPNHAVSRTLKTQTYFMTLIFFFMQRIDRQRRDAQDFSSPRGLEFREYSGRVMAYLRDNKIIQTHNTFLFRTQLFPVLFNLLRICVDSSANFNELLGRANAILREYLEKHDYNRINLTFLTYHFALEKVEVEKEVKVVNFEQFLDKMIEYQSNKKYKGTPTALSFDELFAIDETGRLREFPIQSYHKFFIFVMLKLLAVNFKITRLESDFAQLAKYVEKVVRDVKNLDYDLKYQTFLLLKAVLMPEEVQASPTWRIFGVPGMSFEHQLKLITCAYIDNSFCMADPSNEGFKRMFDEYYAIVLHFVRKYPAAEELPEFCRQVVHPNFMLFDEPTKRAFVVEIEKVVGATLFDRLQFFFRGQDAPPGPKGARSEAPALVPRPERNDNFEAFTSVVIHFLRSSELRRDSVKVTLNFNDCRAECSPELLAAFISLQEIEGAENAFSVRLLKQILATQFRNLSRGQQEEFLVNFVDFLATQSTLASPDYHFYLEILLALTPQVANSEVLASLSARNPRLLKILNQYELIDPPAARRQRGEGRGGRAERLKMAQANNYRAISGLTRRELLRGGLGGPRTAPGAHPAPELLLRRGAGGGGGGAAEGGARRGRPREHGQVGRQPARGRHPARHPPVGDHQGGHEPLGGTGRLLQGHREAVG